MTDFDVVIVGGGHNGLTCAAYLARAGRRVAVVESQPILGGYCTTEESVAGAPGYLMNPGAIDTALTQAPVSIVGELDLARYGLRFAYPEPWASYVNSDGAWISFWTTIERTSADIARLSRRDAAAFERFCAVLTDAWYALLPYFQDHPVRPRARTVAQVAWRLAKGRKGLREALDIFINSPEQVLEERFERPELKAALANLAAMSTLPLQEPGSSGTFAAMCSYFRWGVARPIGGAGAFTEAIAACARAQGVVVRTDARVAEVLVRDGRAYGVKLHDGSELLARHVVGAVDPHTLLGDLVDDRWVPVQARDQLRAMGNLRWNITYLKCDMALSRASTLAYGPPELKQGYLLIGETIETVKRAQMQAMAGELPDDPVLVPTFPSVLDPSQVPAGSGGETVYMAMSCIPHTLADGRDWDDVKEAAMKQAYQKLEQYVPGITGNMIGHSILSPKDLQRKSAHRGNIVHVDLSMQHLGPRRPIPAMAGYRTPVEHLWHTGAGAHPMGTLTGWSGRSTARTVHRALRRGA